MHDPIRASSRPPPAAEPPLDQELATRLRSGDPSALDELLQRHWAGLVGYAEGIVGDFDAAEDIAQRTFLQLWQQRSRWRLGGSLRGFLYRVARNLALNEKRRVRVRSRWSEILRRDEPQGPVTPEQVARGSEVQAAIEAALDRLPPRRREVVELVRFHELSYREVAEVMGISTQTVANQMSTALAELRSCLSPFLSDPRPRNLRVVSRSGEGTAEGTGSDPPRRTEPGPTGQ